MPADISKLVAGVRIASTLISCEECSFDCHANNINSQKKCVFDDAADFLEKLGKKVDVLETENAALKEELHAAMAYVPRSCATCKRDDNTDCRNNGGCNWEWNKACSPEAARSLIEENQRLKEKCAALLHDLGSTPSACDFCTGEDCKRNVMGSGGCHFIWRGPQKKS